MSIDASTPSSPIRTIIVEDENLYRELLTLALSQRQDIEVVASFGSSREALAAMAELKPDVALLDIELGAPPNGIELGRQLRKTLPKIGVVLLSNYDEIHFLSSLPEETVGGWSYLLKKSVNHIATLARAIEGAANGLVVLDSELLSGLKLRHGSPLQELTPRQREILTLLAAGYSNPAIAERLSLAEKSVENQVSLLYHTLGIQRAQSDIHPRVKAVLTYLQESHLARG